LGGLNSDHDDLLFMLQQQKQSIRVEYDSKKVILEDIHEQHLISDDIVDKFEQ
jgi:hypothetical protein